MDPIATVKDTIARYGLLSSGDSVLVGLSGGPDSVALLHLLGRLKGPLKLKLSAVYFNHGLRPQAALKEEKFCHELCTHWRVPLIIIREDVPALARSRKVGFEEAARDFRYEHLEKLSSLTGSGRIALGHQADDQAETVLFRVVRGTGRTGLLGIPAKRDRIIRPLLDLPRSEIIGYLKSNRIRYCTDSSNKLTKYRRNFIREKLIPLLKANLNPQVESALRDLADTLGQEEAYLAQATEISYRRIRSRSNGGKLMLDLEMYAEYPIWLRRRILRRALNELSGGRLSLDKPAIERLDMNTISLGRSITITADYQATVTGTHLVLHKHAPVVAEINLPTDNKWVALGGLAGEIRARHSKLAPGTLKKIRRALKVTIDQRKAKPPLSVRSIRAGDRFRPLGLEGQKKVSDYLIDHKVPAVFRDEVPVVCDRNGIIWLVGWEIAERVKLDAKTYEVTTLEFRNVKAS